MMLNLNVQSYNLYCILYIISNRNGHLFVAFVVDRFGTVIKIVQNLMFQMFKRNAKNSCNEISDAEANIVASRKLKF